MYGWKGQHFMVGLWRHLTSLRHWLWDTKCGKIQAIYSLV